LCPKFMTTLPKSGTYLLNHILRLEWPVYEGKRINFKFRDCEKWYFQYCFISPGRHHIRGHIGYSEPILQLIGNRIPFFLYRDPRDIIVSWAYYMDETPDNSPIATIKGVDIKHSSDRIAVLIETLPFIVRPFLGWLDYEKIISLRFEDIINNPEQALEPVAAVIPEPLEYLVARSKMRASPTYRRAKLGNWHDEFQPHHIKAFEAIWGDIMDRMRYE